MNLKHFLEHSIEWAGVIGLYIAFFSFLPAVAHWLVTNDLSWFKLPASGLGVTILAVCFCVVEDVAQRWEKR